MAIYYVSPTGDDSATGLSTDVPLLNISTAIAKADVTEIRLMTGTHRQYAVCDKNDILIRNNPTDVPVWCVTKERTGWAATAGQTKTFEMAPGEAIYQVWETDTLDANQYPTMLVKKTSIATVEATAGTWWYDEATGKLYVHSTDDADPSTHTIDAAFNVTPLIVRGDNISITGIVFQMATYGLYCSKTGAAKGIHTITGCDARYCATHGFYADDCVMMKTDNCKAYGNGSDGFNYNKDAAGHHYAIDCEAHHNGDDGISNHDNEQKGVQLTIIRGNFHDNTDSGVSPAYYAHTDIYGATFKGNTGPGVRYYDKAYGVVEDCYIDGNATGLESADDASEGTPVGGGIFVARRCVLNGNTADFAVAAKGLIRLEECTIDGVAVGAATPSTANVF